jgi:hypothetical protein
MVIAMELWILSGLIFKHFIADFVLQRRYQYMNKGKYGHPGGLLHSGIHMVGTMIVLTIFLPLPLAFFLSVGEGVVHYHIDWLKANLNRMMKLHAAEGNEYWFWFGFDQLLHHMTYIGLIIVMRELL